MLENPFRPGFASAPPVIAGREQLLGEFERILSTRDLAVGSFRATYGNRGVGKTVLHDWFADKARARGWLVVAHEARPGDDVLAEVLRQIEHAEALTRRAARLLVKTREAWGDETQRVNLGVYQRESRRQRKDPLARFKQQLAGTWTRVVEDLGGRGGGLAVFIDEAQNADPAELSPIGPALQQLERSRTGPCAVMFSGLPDLPDFIVNAFTYGERMTFNEIGNLDRAATAHALVLPLHDAGYQINNDALDTLIASTGGYPYLIQLYGYHAVNAAGQAAVITVDHVQEAIDDGQQNLNDGLYRARWAKLPERERQYMTAMASIATSEPVSSRAIADSLGKAISELSEVRALLIHRGLLISPSRGLLECTLPGFLDHIKVRHTDTSPTAAQRILDDWANPTPRPDRDPPGPTIEAPR